MAMTRRHAIVRLLVAYAAAIAVYWTAVAVLGANLFYSSVLFVPFSLLSMRIFSHKWPDAEVPWTPPWRGIRRPRDTTDDENPEIAVRLRILNIGFLVVTGLVLVTVVIDIVRSVTGTSP